ncbi:lytic transglycosylase domain-containing protein [Desulfatibacillum aliphaticivorans]|uniref:lytic transglycosylase domain-containing protein n=1 Tax=Desulfatibacillum aliphaticivorans TaxID=218208 RepID=UPI0004202074|nr:lytic transglycosylase domain-containing protein [Desulfatibacillum aliphaticivorans]
MKKLLFLLIFAGLGAAAYYGLQASGYTIMISRPPMTRSLSASLAQAEAPESQTRKSEAPPPPSPDIDIQNEDPDEDKWIVEEESQDLEFPSVADEYIVYEDEQSLDESEDEIRDEAEAPSMASAASLVQMDINEPVDEFPLSPPGDETVPSLLDSLRVTGPLYFCGEQVPLDNPEVRERLEKELMLSLWDRPQVLLWIKRSTRYMPIIDSKLKEAGMPRDLRYVAVAESALRPHAGSPKGAMGFWQFIKGTGKRYGLEINRDVDDRREIRRSTDAAILYFKELYKRFGSWTLAAAAYNMGEDGLESQILVQEQINYYQLYLPLETQRYIFRILSAKLLMEHPEKFGFHLKPEDYYPLIEVENVEFKTVAKAPLTLVAKAANTSFKHIKDLNPHLRGYDLSAGNHSIMVPKGASDGFNERFLTLFSKWFEQKAGHIYVVKPGDSLTRIAEAHGIPLPTLAMWNRINLDKPIVPGQRLVVYKRADK